MGFRKPTSFPVKCVSLPLKSLQIMLGAGKHGTKDRKSEFFSLKIGKAQKNLQHYNKLLPIVICDRRF